VGGGNVNGTQRVVVDDGSSSYVDWLLYGMIFFALICFITLPISAMILMEAKKTNAVSQAALTETKKLQRELKPKKEAEDE
jgi:hypothetical protein